tara:strand:- start:578 stop:1183 length:606 start_codon:yes stop_codon:yes gene_type:complete
MKEILITSNSLKKFEQTYFSIDSNWFEYFSEYKVVPLPNNIQQLNNYIKSTSTAALVLSGGGDILKNNLAGDGFDKNREEVEEFLIDYSIVNSIPLIAVCRGMQKVLTHLDENIDFVINRISIKEKYEINQSNRSSKSKRTCFNNYSIPYKKQIEKSWEILEIDKNNNLLCIKHKKYKILCFMWHPERDSTDFDIISTFIN